MEKAKVVLNVVGWACIIVGACIVGVGATKGPAWGIACFALCTTGMVLNGIVSLLPKPRRGK